MYVLLYNQRIKGRVTPLTCHIVCKYMHIKVWVEVRHCHIYRVGLAHLSPTVD